MPEISIEMNVNGRNVAKRANPSLRLLDFLRDELFLTGTKEGCGEGECGTCSVFIDGALYKSCLLPMAKAAGRKVVTIEGLAKDGELTTVQRAFHKTGASQCGFCIPGMVMAATATLARNPQAEMEEIKEGLSGNICRCTGYQKIFEAVELARDVMNGTARANALDEEEHRDSYIGANVRRIDAPSKVTGRLKYAGDMVMARMLHMKVLRSPLPHARIEVDVSAAQSMPGVEAVITSRDVPGVDGFGVFIEDQPVLARERVRFVGEAIAAVVAETPVQALEALRQIAVRYDPLPTVFDPEEAMRPGAPVLHQGFPNNITKHVKIRKGNADEGFAASELIVEETYTTQPIEHAYLEPEAGLAYVEPDDTVTIYSPSQNITHHRHMLARILNRPINKVRMVMSPVGGGFGGKEDMIYQGMLAIAAIKTGRPVRYVFTREESFIASAKRHPFRIRYRMGLKRNGKICAIQMDMLSDGGAYALSTPAVMTKSAALAAGPYAVDNVHIDARGVYTNNTPSGAFRALGSLQSQFATEAHLDLCASRLAMDPIELRRINAMRDGAVTHTQQQLKSVSLLRALDAAAKAARWQPAPPHARGDNRTDVDGPGTRPPCTLGARLRQHQTSPSPSEVAAE
jgi:xanthine dehydrogenase molybdopterin-binding subunit B/aerobic-type carbon monoxide dehydrogenase small subunit (CoxS/CutS family)